MGVGDRLRTGRAPVRAGKPEGNFYRLIRREVDELREVAEDPSVIERIVALEETAALHEARIVALEEIMAALEETVGTSPAGEPTVHMYSRRLEALLEALLLEVRALRPKTRKKR